MTMMLFPVSNRPGRPFSSVIAVVGVVLPLDSCRLMSGACGCNNWQSGSICPSLLVFLNSSLFMFLRRCQEERLQNTAKLHKHSLVGVAFKTCALARPCAPEGRGVREGCHSVSV